MLLSNSSALALKTVALRVTLFFFETEFFIPALEFGQPRRGAVRIERVHLLDETRFIDPVGEIGETDAMLAERVRDTGALALARQQCDGVGARGQRRGPCRHGLLGPAPPGARFVERSLRCLPLLGRRAPFRFGRARLDKALVQEARGCLRRQVCGSAGAQR